MRLTFISLAAVALTIGNSNSAFAQTTSVQTLSASAAAAAETAVIQDPSPQAATAPAPRAFEYSDGYRLRAKIHRISSFATLPLFGAEGIIGQSLYSDPTEGKRSAHLAVASGIGALFAVNTTTGVWNLIEARKDPNNHRKRLVHGLLMLGSDAGFLATAALGPSTEHGEIEGSRAAHRAVAITSIGLATTGYLIMLFSNH